MQGKPYTRRLLELEERFAKLEPSIPDGSQKEVFSVLHLDELDWALSRVGVI
jgi:hypothetical protein